MQLELIRITAVTGFVLVAVQDLRLGFDFEVAQLLFQARDRARQLTEIEVDRAELLLQARAGNAGFAGDVQNLVEKVCADESHFLPLRASPTITDCGYTPAPSKQLL